MRFPNREFTLPSFLLLLLSCGLLLAIPALAQTTPPPPTVTVNGGDPGDPDVNQQVTSNVTANVTNPPQPAAEHTLVPHWSWNIGDAEYSASGQDGTFSPVTDGSQFKVVGNTDDTQANATFTATYNSDGYYEVQVIGTVKYVDPDDSSNNQGPYSNPVGPNQPDPNTPLTGYVGDANDDTSQMPPTSPDIAAPSAQVNPMATPAGSSTKLKVKVTGIRIKQSVQDVTGTTQSAWAGQQISLSATVPSGLSLSNAQWYLGPSGHPIANWSNGVRTLLSSSAIQSTSITFYWEYPASGVVATYGGTDASGVYRSASVFFNTKKPSTTFTGTLATLQAYYNHNLGYVFSLGNALNGPDGINFAWGFPGNSRVTLIQMLYQYDGGAPGSSLGSTIPLGSPPELDTANPYGLNSDTPELDDNFGYNATFDFKAVTYLMWAAPAPNSIQVPIATVTWGFNASVSNGWSQINATTPPYANTTYGVNEEPVWTQVFKP